MAFQSVDEVHSTCMTNEMPKAIEQYHFPVAVFALQVMFFTVCGICVYLLCM